MSHRLSPHSGFIIEQLYLMMMRSHMTMPRNQTRMISSRSMSREVDLLHHRTGVSSWSCRSSVHSNLWSTTSAKAEMLSLMASSSSVVRLRHVSTATLTS